ncbi:MAG: MarR family transcriptional regulator [Bacteroidetes bacterium]|nr:MarR family transcriptional regulator [Bacteroidota bacterium]
MENNQKIIETFKAAQKPLKAGEVAELSGIDKKEVEKLIKKMTAGGVFMILKSNAMPL